MNSHPANFWHLQCHPAVRLRRESWGGIAFNRSTGDLLDLDREGFALLSTLATACTLKRLRQSLQHQGHAVRLPDVIAFAQTLENRGFVLRVPGDVSPLPADDTGAEQSLSVVTGLRAPLVAHWAVTYRCNLSCPFCYSESSPQREPGPDASQRLRIVERLALWGVFEVALGGGEPTILPDFAGLLSAIRTSGMVPNVTTNGTLHHTSIIEALAQHAGVVHLSADRPDLLDAARGPGTFVRLRETARRLREAGVSLGVNLLLTPDIVHAIRHSLQTALELGAQAVTFLRPKGTWTGSQWSGFPAVTDLTVLAADLKAFIRTRPPLRLCVDTALRGEWATLGLFDDPEPDVFGCGGGQRHVAITPEGDVYPCSHVRREEYRMGNLLMDDGEELWTGEMGWRGRKRYVEDCDGKRCACRA